MFLTDRHGRPVFSGKSKSPQHIIPRPILSVVVVPNGPLKGQFGLIAHGLNDQNMMTIVELRVFEKFEEAAVMFDKLKAGQVKAEDIPDYEVTPRMLSTWRDRYARVLQ